MARRTIASPKTWNARTLWGSVIAKPASYIPAVILGLLLNVLDALSYGEHSTCMVAPSSHT